MERVLITGTNRGIGFELVRQYLARGARVYAGVRQSGSMGALSALNAPRLTIVRLDVTSATSLEMAREQVQEPLDVLINNAAINPEQPAYEAFGQMQASALLDVLQTNSVAPLLVAQAFFPLLRQGANPRLINISSEMASLADKDYGGSYAYCMSKAALNMATRGLAADLRRAGIIVLALDPGWVRTDMGGAGATLSAEESVRGCLRVIDGLTPDDSGRFLNYAGQEHRW